MLQFGTFYHLFNRANGDDVLFREEKNYAFFLKKYHLHLDPVSETLAWCLMPNHFHVLVRIRTEEEILEYLTEAAFGAEAPTPTSPKFRTLEKFKELETSPETANHEHLKNIEKLEKFQRDKQKFLSKQFSNFFSSYAQAFNKVYSRCGSLFMKSFKRKEITDDVYLRNVILYSFKPCTAPSCRRDWRLAPFFLQKLSCTTAGLFSAVLCR